MTRTRQITVGLFAGASLLGLSASPLIASHFKNLSDHHTNWGVAQFNYANVGSSNQVTLTNPNHVTQVAAVLAYNRGRVNYTCCSNGRAILEFSSSSEFPLEEFLGCVVVKLTPHAAVMVDTPTGGPDIYREVIWAPAVPVRAPGTGGKARRLADGLGGRTWNGTDEDGTTGERDHDREPYMLGHPSLFSLPDAAVDYVFDFSPFDFDSPELDRDQNTAAQECICEGIFDLAGPPFFSPTVFKVFEAFGVDCIG